MKTKIVILGLILLCIKSAKTYAEIDSTKDSIYYLLDTVKTPKNDRMWNISIEHPITYFTILCPCLKYGQNPTFVYGDKGKSEILKRKDLKSLRLISIASLITKVKSYTHEDFLAKRFIFLIEPYGQNYIIHKAVMLEPHPQSHSIDYELISPDTIIKSKKP